MPEKLLLGEPGGKTAKGMRRRHMFWRLGVNLAKAELYLALQRKAVDDDDGVVRIGQPHAPMEYGLDYFKQLAWAEYIVSEPNKITGEMERKFKLRRGAANEALDLHVYNRAAAEILRLPAWGDKEWTKQYNKIHNALARPLTKEERLARRAEIRKLKLARRKSK